MRAFVFCVRDGVAWKTNLERVRRKKKGLWGKRRGIAIVREMWEEDEKRRTNGYKRRGEYILFNRIYVRFLDEVYHNIVLSILK